MKQLVVVLLISSCAFFAHAQSPLQTLTLAAPHWCPFSCDPTLSDNNRGILVDYLSVILARHQIELDVHILPWSRAIKGAESGKYQGLVSAVHSEAPSLLFPDAPTSNYANCFFVNDKNRYWKYYDPKSLEEIKFAYLKDYGYEKPILDYINQPLSKTLEVSGSNGVARMIRLLEVGRVEAFIEEGWVAQWEIKRTPGLLQEKLHKASCMPGTPFYTAINPGFSAAKTVIDILNQELSLPANKKLLHTIARSYLR